MESEKRLQTNFGGLSEFSSAFTDQIESHVAPKFWKIELALGKTLGKEMICRIEEAFQGSKLALAAHSHSRAAAQWLVISAALEIQTQVVFAW